MAWTFGIHRAGPFDLLGAHHGLGVVAGFLGEQFLRAGIERAESARAAHRRPLVEIIRAGAGEGQRAHDLMRFDGVAQQEARAIFGAVAALVAGGFADLGLRLGRLELALDDMMRARQNHHAGGSLGDGRVEIVRVRAHHQAADDQHRIVRGQSAGKFNALAKRRADGHSQRRRRFHRAGNRQHLMRQRLAVVRGGDVHERLDVVDHHAHGDGNAAGRNQFARDVIDQIVFVARRIIIAQQLHAHVRAFARGRHGFDGVLLFAFDANDAFARAHGFHGQLHAAHQFGGVFAP